MGQHILGVVGVLIFVDQQVLKTILQFPQHVRVIAQGMGGAQEKIVEIQGVVGVQKLLILGVNPRDRPLIKIARLLRERFGADELVLGVADGGVNGRQARNWCWKCPASSMLP